MWILFQKVFLLCYVLQQIWFFLIKSLFFFKKKKNHTKTYLTFFKTEILFFLITSKQIWFFFTNLFFFHKNKSDFSLQILIFFFIHKRYLNFSKKKKWYIHKINLLELISINVYHVCSTYHSHHAKMVYWSLESRRLDSVWAEWVPNIFPFCNLTSEFSSFG